MLAGTLAFILGIYCLMQLHWLPSLWIISILPLLLLLARFSSVFRIIFLFFAGFCWALFRADFALKDTLQADIENSDVYIQGVIISIPESHDDHIRFLIDTHKITSLKAQPFSSAGIVRLSWYKNQTIPVPGDIWQFKVKLKRPYGFMNSGGFDYEAWMLRQGINASGYVKFDKHNIKIGEANTHFIQKVRYKLAQQLKQTLDKPLLGLVLALSLGDRSQLEREQWKVLSQTGTNHLIAISGLHLSLITGLIYFIACFIWSRFYCLTLRIPAPLFASIIAFATAFIYAALSGFALPAQRALIMIAVFLLGLFSGRQVFVTNVICVALTLVLILDPFAIIAPDFYLSFFAVIFILYISRFRINDQANVTRWILLQCMLSIALCPILIFWFKQVPLYSILANLIAIPLVGFLIVPLCLIALILLFPLPEYAESLYFFIGKINEQCWAYFEYLSQQNYAIIPIAAPNLFVLVLAIIGVLILLMPKGLPARWLAIIFMMPLLFPLTQRLKESEFNFDLLDVGQGLAVVIKTKDHVLVYDTGAKFSERFNIGDAVIKPYLRSKGINQLSMLLISHGDNDHIGGAESIIDNFEINQTLSSEPTHIAGKKVENCYAGQKWTWDSVDFEILHPKTKSIYTGNNASCVLKISSKWGSVLLTGDIEKEAEESLLISESEKLQADVLLVPHHGSRTSSTKEFITAVSPQYAIVSAGYRNRFGLPKQDIMAQYEAQDVKTFVSYKTGELSVKFRDTGLQIDEFRTKNRRFWHY
jgi:competence protein ComEC